MTSDPPSKWPTAPLGSLLTEIQPGFASGKHNSTGDGLPHFRPMNVSSNGRIDRRSVKYVDPATSGRPDLRLHRGDVLFNNTNSPELVGKTAFFDSDDQPAFSNHMTRLRTDPSRLDPQYLALRLHFAWRKGYFAEHCNNHVSQASVSRDVLRGFPIELPPIEVQRSIARLGASLDNRRMSAAGHIQIARRAIDRFRQRVLAAACAGRLTADWRDHNESTPVGSLLGTIRTSQRPFVQPPNVSNLDRLPESWAWATVGEIGRVQLGGTPSRKTSMYWNGDVAWVSSGEVANCRITRTRETITEAGLESSNAKMYPAGTVLIAMIGEGKTRGQSAILDIAASTNQNVAGVLPDISIVNPEYLWRWALAQYEVTRAVGRGGNQPALNGQKIRELTIPVPPLEEQLEIVRRVDHLVAAADAIRVRIETAERLADRASEAILANALRGELATSVAHGSHG